MIVSCSACSTKFNIPDSKVAGKRARMKCKKCGASIAIDGTHLAEASAAVTPTASAQTSRVSANEPAAQVRDISTRWRVAEPSGKRHELTLDEVVKRYALGQFESGTLVCEPGKMEWLPPYDFPLIVSKANGAGDARASQPTFSDETVALGAAETEALKRQSELASFAQSPRAAPAPQGSGTPTQQTSRPNAKLGVPDTTEKNTFFDESDVEDAMSSFDSLTSQHPPASPSVTPQAPQSPAAATLSPATSQSPAGSRLPSSAAALSTSTPPAAPSSSPSAAPPAPPSVPPPSAPAQGSTPPPPPSSLPAPPPSPHSSAPPPFPAPPSPSQAPPAPVPQPPLPPAPEAPSFTSPEPPQWEADSASGPSSEVPPAQSQSVAPKKRSSMSAFAIVLLLLLLIGGAVAAIYVLKPALFQKGMHEIHQLMGQAEEAPNAPAVTGPAFDTPAAGVVLGRAAELTSKCREAQGPQGKGRARVLYSNDGHAKSVLVSAPFTDTTVGRCVIEVFMATEVPAFGGDPVIVNKTFEVN